MKETHHHEQTRSYYLFGFLLIWRTKMINEGENG